MIAQARGPDNASSPVGLGQGVFCLLRALLSCYMCIEQIAMPQLHLYVSEDVARVMRARAAGRRVSLSRYLADLVASSVATDWPPRFFEDVAGAWKGRRVRRPPQGRYQRRDSF